MSQISSGKRKQNDLPGTLRLKIATRFFLLRNLSECRGRGLYWGPKVSLQVLLTVYIRVLRKYSRCTHTSDVIKCTIYCIFYLFKSLSPLFSNILYVGLDCFNHVCGFSFKYYLLVYMLILFSSGSTSWGRKSSP